MRLIVILAGLIYVAQDQGISGTELIIVLLAGFLLNGYITAKEREDNETI